MTRRIYLVGLTVAALALLTIYIACSGGGGTSTSKGSSVPATINVSLSDPHTCAVTASGPYTSIVVAVTDVQIHTSASAGDNDAGWIDVTPQLKASGVPKQVDLLGIPDNQCFLAQLGSNDTIAAGTYQQARIFLADNTVDNANKLAGSNKCASNAVNCVILASDPANPRTLQLSSEALTGLKIPPGQIAGGKFTVADGDVKDLNIDFDSCASIVLEGDGTYRLKPVLHAGEVSAGSVINGTLIDNSTGNPIAGGTSIVALEQTDAGGVGRVVMQTTADASGLFSFCPVPAGTYDVVAAAVNGSGTAYAATITTGVQAGSSLGNIPMNPVTGATTSVGAIQGDITAVNASSNGADADVRLSALAQVTIGGTISQFTIPVSTPSTMMTPSATLLVPVSASGCSESPCYTMNVPPVNPTVGAFSATPPGTSYTQGTGDASYTVEGQAFLPTSSETDCTPPKLTTTEVTVSPGATTTAPTLAFTGCQ